MDAGLFWRLIADICKSGGDAVQKYRQFVERHRRYENLFAGEW